jgi:hypothetical protein
MWGRATYGALSATLKFRNVAMFDFPLMAKHHISLISLWLISPSCAALT